MKKIFPKVYNDQLLICVGDDESIPECVVGESILNTDSKKEKAVWRRAIRIACIDEFEKIRQLVRDEKIDECFNLINEVNEVIEEHDANWQLEIIKLKQMVNDSETKQI